MNQTLLLILLIVAMLLPLGAAVVLRTVGWRLAPTPQAIVTAVLFGSAMIAALVLARADLPTLRIGGTTVLTTLGGDQPAGSQP